jgi:shikimate dehydrogenase
VNLTVPHKTAALSYVDELTARAERIGAINTLIIEADDLATETRRVVGDNTDAPGFSLGLAGLGEGPCHHAVVLGGGGAARAIVDALVFEHGAEVSWISRAPERLPDLPHVQRVAWARLGECREIDVLVNATTVGMPGSLGELPAPLPWFAMHDATRVVDIVIAEQDTPLVQRARAEGLRAQDGRPMLVWQGALALSGWLGVELPDSAVQAMAAAIGANLGEIAR